MFFSSIFYLSLYYVVLNPLSKSWMGWDQFLLLNHKTSGDKGLEFPRRFREGVKEIFSYPLINYNV